MNRPSLYRLSVAKEVGSDPTAAGGGVKLGTMRRQYAFVGRGEAKMLVKFPACRKWKNASRASTKRVAADGVQRRRTDAKAHTASPQQLDGLLIRRSPLESNKGSQKKTTRLGSLLRALLQEHILPLHGIRC